MLDVASETVSTASPTGPYHVPRRFGMVALLVVTTIIAVSYGLLMRLGFHPLAITVWVVFIAGVAAAQAVLFGGRRPRLASMVGGELLAIFAVPGMLVVPLIELHHLKWPSWLWDQYQGLLVEKLPYSILLGPILGYVAGGFLAGLVLVMDAVERRTGR